MTENFDIIIIGGGVSGIGAACQLKMKMPHLTYVILESRGSLGGTWDHYKYPGVRTDSDMYTMAYSFNPWKDNKTTASASIVRSYLIETAEKYDVERHVRYHHKAKKAKWNSKDNKWTIDVEDASGKKVEFIGSFIFMCSGYTNFNHIYDPKFPDIEKFQGKILHPQNWPKEVDYKDKEIIVIGSGATAITIVPALSERAKHVIMLQRSPSYILQLPNIDPIAKFCSNYLPLWLSHFIMRTKNIFEQQIVYIISKIFNNLLKRFLIGDIKKNVKDWSKNREHFIPTYPVLTQRLCLSPDTVFTDSINNQDVSIITDTIQAFTEKGLLLTSGRELPADIVVTATGFDLYALGGIEFEIDGVPVPDATTKCTYKGVMLTGIPNMVVAMGYLTASWTLRIDMVFAYACRLLQHMEQHGLHSFCPRTPPADMPLQSIFSIFNSSYLTRGSNNFFHCGNKFPYAVNHNYYVDWWTFHYGALEDQWLQLH